MVKSFAFPLRFCLTLSFHSELFAVLHTHGLSFLCEAVFGDARRDCVPQEL